MSDTKHDVTVYDRIPATAQVSVAQVEAYLRRAGWTMRREHVDHWSEWWDRAGDESVDVPPASEFRPRTAQRLIERIAECERRQPSAVIADIAREPAP